MDTPFNLLEFLDDDYDKETDIIKKKKKHIKKQKYIDLEEMEKIIDYNARMEPIEIDEYDSDDDIRSQLQRWLLKFEEEKKKIMINIDTLNKAKDNYKTNITYINNMLELLNFYYPMLFIYNNKDSKSIFQYNWVKTDAIGVAIADVAAVAATATAIKIFTNKYNDALKFYMDSIQKIKEMKDDIYEQINNLSKSINLSYRRISILYTKYNVIINFMDDEKKWKTFNKKK